MDNPTSNDLTSEAMKTGANERSSPAAVGRDIAHGVEKFSAIDLTTLRSELLQSGVDSFQAAEIVASFLTGRGYACSTYEAREIAFKIELQGVTPEHVQAELESLARVM